MRFRGKTTVLGLALGLGITACGDDLWPNTGGMPTSPTTGDGSTGAGTTTTGTTTGATSEASSTADPPTTSATGGKADMGSGGGLCDVWTQDCPNGEKCTAYGPPNSYIPTGIKCVPEPESPKAHNEPCSQFGEGLGDDDCAIGSVCLDLDYDGSGFCLPYCTGDKDNPMCEEDRTCVKLFFGYEFGNCFSKCDPLVQDCAPDEGCYMDAIMVGNTGFVCLPVVQEGHGKVYNAPCFGWSSCEPGYACIYDSFLPDCDGNGLCCSPWCDITEADPCDKFDPALECIAWFNKQPPPGLENVGICGIPQ